MATPQQPRVLEGEPSGPAALLRAALPAVPVVNRLPGLRKGPADGFDGLALTRPAVRVDRAATDAYAAVCGFPRKDTVPLTYPHLLAFPLHVAIMAEPAFPFPAVGTVHLDNTITAHRAVAVGETLSVTTTVGPPQPHAKGTALIFVTDVRSGDDVVWESTSTYLRRGKGTGDAPAGLAVDERPQGAMTWRLPGDLGRRYAAVSGDHNPIHLYPLTARALGFRRQIAHGMCTLARCVAALENRLPERVTVEAAFKKPVFLPGTVAFGTTRRDGALAFALSRPEDGAPHLVGRARTADA